MEPIYQRQDVYVMAHCPAGIVWIGRATDTSGNKPHFETLVRDTPEGQPLPERFVDSECALVLGVRVLSNRLREVVYWVDTAGAVDVSAVAVDGTPALLIVGEHRLAILAACSPGTEEAEVLL